MIVVLLVGLARVLALARGQEVHLPPSRRQRARVPAAHAEQHELGDVAEVEADAAPVRAAVLAHLVPDDVGLVGEAPRPHHRDALGQQRVRAPRDKDAPSARRAVDRQRHDFGERQGAVARQPLVLGRDLAGAVGELPRRVGKQGGEAAGADKSEQVLIDGGHGMRFAAIQRETLGEQRLGRFRLPIDSGDIRLARMPLGERHD